MNLLTNKIKTMAAAVQSQKTGWLMTFLMIMLALVMVSWLVGYWCNGLIGTKFEIGSCWQGLAGIVTGLGGLAGMTAKYYVDSKYNSQEGERPAPASRPVEKEEKK